MPSPVIRHAAVEQRHSQSEKNDELTFSQEIIQMVHNDISAVQSIHIATPEIETTNFEDTYTRN